MVFQGSLPGEYVAFTEPHGIGIGVGVEVGQEVRLEKYTRTRDSASVEMWMRAVFGEA